MHIIPILTFAFIECIFFNYFHKKIKDRVRQPESGQSTNDDDKIEKQEEEQKKEDEKEKDQNKKEMKFCCCCFWKYECRYNWLFWFQIIQIFLTILVAFFHI